MVNDTLTIAEFAQQNGITIFSTERVESNPNMNPDDPWVSGTYLNSPLHWKVTLSRTVVTGRRSKLTVYFSMGSGTTPTVEEVLNSLSLDSSSVDDHSFEDFCSELGYDTDSRKAERTYKACQHSAKRLLNFLGSDLYGQLLYSTEGL